MKEQKTAQEILRSINVNITHHLRSFGTIHHRSASNTKKGPGRRHVQGKLKAL